MFSTVLRYIQYTNKKVKKQLSCNERNLKVLVLWLRAFNWASGL